MEDHEVAFYQGLARQHRGTSRQVGAWSEQSQTARFEVMFEVLDSLLDEGLAGLSILDFGCGKGDLLAYLDRHGRLKTVRYIGIDGRTWRTRAGWAATTSGRCGGTALTARIPVSLLQALEQS